MTRNLKRYYGHGDFHFIIFSCYHRFPFLRAFHARDTFISSLSAIRERYRFLLFGYVVMPEHVHLLISEIPSVTPSIIVKVLKHHVSVNMEKCPTPLWQPRFL
jgi:putative transposase